MALTKVGKQGVAKEVIKSQTNLNAAANDADRYLIYDESADALKYIAASNVTPNATLITGKSALGEGAASNDQILIFDTSAGVLKKVSQQNLLNFPSISSVSPTNVNTGDGTGNHTFTITGSGFTGGSAKLINTGGSDVAFDTVTVNSDTQITGVIAKSSLPDGGEPYDVRVTASTGLLSTLENQINVNAQPVFTTSAGSLRNIVDGARTGIRITVNAVDPESAGNVTFEKQSGVFPPGLSLSNEGSEGGTAVISGNTSAVGTNTTHNFVLRAVDAASNTSSRAFSITVLAPQYQSFTADGTFAVPVGVSTLNNVLVVAGGGGGGGAGPQHVSGGGGGGGGLIYMPNVPVVPGGTVAITVGSGGHGFPNGHGAGNTGQDSVFGASPSPGTTNPLTAKGGGAGGSYSGGGTDGGSGGGGGTGIPSNTYAPKTATQPTQSGDSGAYGFGNPGGAGQPYSNGSSPYGGGGGGAGGGGSGPTGNGGDGKAYTISDGTTSVFYAGGGGGGGAPGAGGGNGGAGNGSPFQGNGQDATANRGSGGGGAAVTSGPQKDGGDGGKGIVIISY